MHACIHLPTALHLLKFTISLLFKQEFKQSHNMFQADASWQEYCCWCCNAKRPAFKFLFSGRLFTLFFLELPSSRGSVLTPWPFLHRIKGLPFTWLTTLNYKISIYWKESSSCNLLPLPPLPLHSTQSRSTVIMFIKSTYPVNCIDKDFSLTFPQQNKCPISHRIINLEMMTTFTKTQPKRLSKVIPPTAKSAKSPFVSNTHSTTVAHGTTSGLAKKSSST